MKRLLTFILASVLAVSALSVTASAAYVRMYAADGRQIDVCDTYVDDFSKVGWDTQPFITVYAADGRTLKIKRSQLNDYLKVGWYTSPPVSSVPKTPAGAITKPNQPIITADREKVPLTFEDYQLSAYGGDTYLQISCNLKVKNNSSRKISSVTIYARTFSPDGTIIKNDNIWVINDFPAGCMLWDKTPLYTHFWDYNVFDPALVPKYFEIYKYSYRYEGSVSGPPTYVTNANPQRITIPEKMRVKQSN